jgi:hypothetical protein
MFKYLFTIHFDFTVIFEHFKPISFIIIYFKFILYLNFGWKFIILIRFFSFISSVDFINFINFPIIISAIIINQL